MTDKATGCPAIWNGAQRSVYLTSEEQRPRRETARSGTSFPGAGNGRLRPARATTPTRGLKPANGHGAPPWKIIRTGIAQTAPVGSFKANALGIYDLGGNVWEWCAEGYKGKTGTRARDWGVLRGGCWATTKRLELQSSYRNVIDRNDRDVIYGFRCVLTALLPGLMNLTSSNRALSVQEAKIAPEPFFASVLARFSLFLRAR